MSANNAAAAPGAAPPTLHDPTSSPAQLVSGLWRSYGPSILASGVALLSSAAANAPLPSLPRGPPPSSTPHLFQPAAGPESGPGPTTQSILDRRRQLEAELATLASPTPESPIPRPSSSPSRSDSSGDLRARIGAGAGGLFEEVDLPSDAEGYDVSTPLGKDADDGEEGHTYRPAAPRRSSWFWGGSQASGGSSGGYDKVKSD